jgi:hypothetical protein
MDYKLEDIDTLFRDAIAKVEPCNNINENMMNGFQEIQKLLNSNNIQHHVKGICAFHPTPDISPNKKVCNCSTMCGCCCCCESFNPLHVYFDIRIQNFTFYDVCIKMNVRTREEFMNKCFDMANAHNGMRYFHNYRNTKRNVCRVPIMEFAQTFRLESKLHVFTRIWEFPILMKDNNFANAIVFIPILQP